MSFSSSDKAPAAPGAPLSLGAALGALDTNSLGADEIAFLTAREAADRGALNRYLTAAGDHDLAVAKANFNELPLLHAPELLAFARAVASEARGPRVDGTARFPATLWLGGVEDTRDGRDFTGNVAQFVRLLEERSRALAAKRTGWVVEPTTCTDGRRTNASTTAMHALFLDCDGTGEWLKLLYTLHQLDLAHIAYQSGGWTPTAPKWRVIFPLSTAFDTSTEQKRESWKVVYHSARIIFGALGELRGHGFDPATDTPCNPWFLTERRAEADSPRAVLWKPGRSLDLLSMVLALPPVEVATIQHTIRGPNENDGEGLSDEKLAEVIDALAKATASVPSGRHDLYLALPGALLDRGVLPDEVMGIIEAVSASYPRTHADKHKDNLHNARTTIAKWEAGGDVTRIGTLNERWPEIAKALDGVLPSLTEILAKSTAAMFDKTNTNGIAGLHVPVALGENLPPPQKKKRRKLSPLGKQIVPIVTQMKRSKNDKRRFAAKLVDRILDGDTFQTEGSTPEQVDVLVCLTVEALGFDLPNATWREILDLASATLLSMDFTQSVERVAKAEAAFLKGQRKKRKWLQKRKDEQAAAEQKTQDFLNEARAMRGKL